MIKFRMCCMGVLIVLMMFFWSFGSVMAFSAIPQVKTLGGRTGQDLLRVDVLENGNMGVFAWDETYPGSSAYDYMPRYFDRYTWSSVFWITFQGQRLVFCGDALQDLSFDADQIYLLPAGEQALSADQTSITTTWKPSQLPGLAISQTVSYLSGSTYIEKRWTLTLAEGTAADLMLLHGGDVYFSSEGAVEQQAEGQLIVGSTSVLNPQQIMFFADSGSSWNHWYAGDWLTACDQVASGLLSSTVQTNAADAGCFVGWNKVRLAAGETWTVITWEDYVQPDAATTSSATSAAATDTTVSVHATSPAATLSPTLVGGTEESTGTAAGTTTSATTIPLSSAHYIPLQSREGAELVQTGETPMLPTLLVLVVFLLAEVIWLRLRLGRGN